MLRIDYYTSFKKDYKRIKKRGYDMGLLAAAIGLLALDGKLPPLYNDHALTGNYSGCRECHITPDWLLVYEIKDEGLSLYPARNCSVI